MITTTLKIISVCNFDLRIISVYGHGHLSLFLTQNHVLPHSVGAGWTLVLESAPQRPLPTLLAGPGRGHLGKQNLLTIWKFNSQCVKLK